MSHFSVAGFLYLLSPLDLLPESVFGFFGYLDDVLVLVIVGLYISIVYFESVRAATARRRQNGGGH
jgi:RING finger protein 170